MPGEKEANRQKGFVVLKEVGHQVGKSLARNNHQLMKWVGAFVKSWTKGSARGQLSGEEFDPRDEELPNAHGRLWETDT